MELLVSESVDMPERGCPHTACPSDIAVDLPTPEERVEILQTIYRSRARDIVNEDVEALAPVARDDRCRDFSGADLMGLFERAATLAINRYLAKGGAMKIQGPEWERALAVTHTSVKDPELYRELKRHL